MKTLKLCRKMYLLNCIFVLIPGFACAIGTSVSRFTESMDDLFQDDYDDTYQQSESSTSFTENPTFSNSRLGFLDKIKENYDRRAWPTYGTNKPTVVTVNLYINSLGSINAANMDFVMDIYLRQSWHDPRLRLAEYGINQTVTFNAQDIIDFIWKPDLFFRNLKRGKFHFVTVPNKLIKLWPDGKILLSMRLTLRLSCHMTFRLYPLDTQRCWVVLGSYAQTVDQVHVKWQEEKAITIEQELELPEFDMKPPKTGAFRRDIDTGSFSFLNVSFVFERQNGYHLVQTYLPTFLIVMISWVSFWLHVDATPGRVTLGVTTLLTLTTVASGIRTQLPPVSYVKAIDVWIGACSVMVFGALLEFTLVNYLSRRKVKPPTPKNGIKSYGKNKQVLEIFNGEFRTDEKAQAPAAVDDNMNCSESDKKACLKRALYVDRISRVLFPLMFFIFNLIYWVYYIYLAENTPA